MIILLLSCVSTVYMYKDLYCSNASLFLPQRRQSDMVANKIISTTTPDGFYGHI